MKRIFLASLPIALLALSSCATKEPSAGITEGGQTSGYKAESSMKKQYRMQEAMSRNMRSLMDPF